MKKTLKFTTNLKCGGCVTKITPYLEKNPQVTHWEVDLEKPEKPLIVQVEGLNAAEIIQMGKAAGFEFKEKRAGFLSRLGKRG